MLLAPLIYLGTPTTPQETASDPVTEVATSKPTTTPEVVAPIEVIEKVDGKSILEERFGPGHPLIEVARCESGYRQYNSDGSVLRGVQNPQDVGILQINEKYHLEDSKRMGIDIHTLEGNMDYAEHLYETQGLRPWNWSKGCWGK